MPRRQGNNPKHRVSAKQGIDSAVLDRCAKHAIYTGSPHHKRFPSDYNFHPPANPRPNKSLCDSKIIIKRNEARTLFREGIRRGMISEPMNDGLPKYVWAVKENDSVYEAKREGESRSYHGYELGGNEVDMKKYIIKEWESR